MSIFSFQEAFIQKTPFRTQLIHEYAFTQTAGSNTSSENGDNPAGHSSENTAYENAESVQINPVSENVRERDVFNNEDVA